LLAPPSHTRLRLNLDDLFVVMKKAGVTTKQSGLAD
jgi:hypothetical protein